MFISNDIHFERIAPFEMMMKYIEIDSLSPLNVFNSHVHSECEIYINVSGDVSFMVEGHIYPIKSGDIIITRPYEYHHCIYNSNALHKHFWILFKSDSNEKLLDIFFKRKTGVNNLLSLDNDKKSELIAHCEKMLTDNLSEAEKYLNFFKLLSFLENATELFDTEKAYHKDTLYAISYINRNFGEKITIAQLASDSHVSINTLERHFAENIKMSPSSYLKKVRMAKAAKFLSADLQVSDVAEKCGFGDYSQFISEFKKFYGTTPLKYKNSVYRR